MERGTDSICSFSEYLFIYDLVPGTEPDSRHKESQLLPSKSSQPGEKSDTEQFQCPKITVIMDL